MNTKGSTAGFTLVEMLVVIAIAATLFSLVGPFAHNQVEKVEASDEWYGFIQFTRQISTDAFFKGQPIILELKGAGATVHQSDLIKKLDYQQINFPEQIIIFNSNGYADQAHVRAYVRSLEKVLILNTKNEQILRAK